MAKVDGDFRLVGKRVYEHTHEHGCLLWRACHHVRVMHADLESHPGDGLTNFDARVLEHVHQLLDARAEDLGEVLLVWTV